MKIYYALIPTFSLICNLSSFFSFKVKKPSRIATIPIIIIQNIIKKKSFPFKMKSYNSDETHEDFLSFPQFKTIIVKAISNNDAKESYLSLCIPKNSRICNNKLRGFLSENGLGFFVKPRGPSEKNYKFYKYYVIS